MAGRIPEAFIQDLLARTDLVDLIDARVPLKRSGGNFVARCPFHQEKTPSFSVSRAKQLYYCFGCGARGTAITFLMDFDRLSFPEAIEALAEAHGLEVPREAGEASEKSSIQISAIFEALEHASKYFQQQLRVNPGAKLAVEYLRGRGISGESAQRFRIGYAPSSSREMRGVGDEAIAKAAGLVSERSPGRVSEWFRDRIMFPIRDRRGRTVGFGGRVIGEGLPKYLNSPETEVFQKHREVYGLFELLEAVRKPEFILVVEGYLDVIALSQFGVMNSVAALGTATSKDHVGLLFRFTSVIVFCFDGDSAGQRATWKAMESSLAHLREGREIRFLSLPEGHDPDSLVREEGPESFRARVLSARPFSEYFFGELQSGLDLKSIEGRAALVAKAKPLLEKVQAGVYREMLEDRLQQLTGRESGAESLGREARSFRSPSLQRKDQPSAFRTFAALLVQRPALVDHLDSRMVEVLASGHRQGPMLRAIVDFLMSHPSVMTAGLVEGMRDSPYGELIGRLAAWETQIADESLEEVFLDHIRYLSSTRSRDVRLRELIDAARKGPLSDDEREELRRLTLQDAP